MKPRITRTRTRTATLRSQGSGLAREDGWILVEVLVAAFVLSVGIGAMLGGLTSSKRLTLTAQRHSVATHVAQRELEEMQALKYSELVLTGNAVWSGDPSHELTSQGLQQLFEAVAGQLSEYVCKAPSDPCDLAGNPKVAPTESFSVASGSSQVTGDIYRYVTMRSESCSACEDGFVRTKRVSVAITLDATAAGTGLTRPVWVSSITNDPNDGMLGAPGQNPPSPTSWAQSFYLYDTRCGDPGGGFPPDTHQEPTGNHTTHDTATLGTTCENADTSKRPDLMGPTAPTSVPDPPFKFSTDPWLDDGQGGFGYPAGLAMFKSSIAGSNTCSFGYTALNASDITKGVNKYNTHAWVTKPFVQPFNLSGKAYLNLYTTSVDNTLGRVRLCVALVDRLAGQPDVVLGFLVENPNDPWPITEGENCGSPVPECGVPLVLKIDLTQPQVRQNARLLLVARVLGAFATSQKSPVLLYDDARYGSFLQIKTTTPCSTNPGAPCSN